MDTTDPPATPAVAVDADAHHSTQDANPGVPAVPAVQNVLSDHRPDMHATESAWWCLACLRPWPCDARVLAERVMVLEALLGDVLEYFEGSWLEYSSGLEVGVLRRRMQAALRDGTPADAAGEEARA